jgi:hypothetical protein
MPDVPTLSICDFTLKSNNFLGRDKKSSMAIEKLA